MIETLNQLDTQVFLFFNSMHCDFMDHFMKMFTMRFIWVPMYASILFLLFRNHSWQRSLIYLVAIVMAITVADQVCASVIRPLVERMRPSNPENPLSAYVHIVDGYRGGRYGFPSCHGANSFALATILALIFPRRRFVLFIMLWALLNSYSRLYLGVHYPGDLLVGAIIGAAGAVGCYYLGRTVANHVEHRSPSGKSAMINIPGLNLSLIGARVGSTAIRVSDVMIFTGVITALIIAILSVLALI